MNFEHVLLFIWSPGGWAHLVEASEFSRFPLEGPEKRSLVVSPGTSQQPLRTYALWQVHPKLPEYWEQWVSSIYISILQYQGTLYIVDIRPEWFPSAHKALMAAVTDGWPTRRMLLALSRQLPFSTRFKKARVPARRSFLSYFGMPALNLDWCHVLRPFLPP